MEKLIVPSILSANNTVMLVERILKVTTELTLKDAKLLKLHNALNAIFERLVKNLKSSSKSELTEVLIMLDKARDQAFLCIRDIIGGMSLSLIEEVKSNAQKLNSIFEKNGSKISRVGYIEESALLLSLFKELDKPEYQQLLSELNLLQFYNSLQLAQTAFDTASNQKSEQKTEKTTETEAATDILKEIYPALTKLVSMVQLYSETEPETYEGPLNQIITYISEVNTTARASITKKQNSNETTPVAEVAK